MFKVKSKRSKNVYTVYQIYGRQFLLFREGEWVWEDFRYYVPLEESDG